MNITPAPIPSIDDVACADAILKTIASKPSLKRLYEEAYEKYNVCLAKTPANGLAIEIGSGLGFSKERVSGLISTDVLAYPGLDQVVDATKMKFADGSLRMICMLNVFHHIPDVGAFLAEAERCLIPGGRILILDEHPGWISTPILKYAHAEPFEPHAEDWKFISHGPLSSANGALAWIVFRRDLQRFTNRYPSLKLLRYEPHTPLRYWLSGGLKNWSLLPNWSFSAATFLDRVLTRLSPQFGSFVDVEIIKQ